MMSNQELQTKPADSTISMQKKDASENNTLHQAAFNSPDEFLSVLKNNFSALSHGHELLGLPDLQVDANDLSLSPSVRQAASIAAKNYDQLTDMASYQLGNLNGDQMTQSNLSYVDDMVKGKILGHAVADTALDVVGVGGLGTMAWAGSGMASAAFEGGVGATLASGAFGMAAIGIVGGGLAVGSVVAAGYLAYRTTIEHKELSKQASADTNQISQWIK